jgi:hypothetical protein
MNLWMPLGTIICSWPATAKHEGETLHIPGIPLAVFFEEGLPTFFGAPRILVETLNQGYVPVG